jgi:hypothetical protein
LTLLLGTIAGTVCALGVFRVEREEARCLHVGAEWSTAPAAPTSGPVVGTFDGLRR